MKHLIWLGLVGLLACEPTPTLQFADLQLKNEEGSLHTLSESRYTLVNLWATWCKPCRQEMPSLEEAQVALKPHGITIILASEEDWGKIDRFRNQNSYTLPYLQLSPGMAALGIHSLPTTYLFDAEGQLLYEHVGAQNWASDSVLNEIITHLAP